MTTENDEITIQSRSAFDWHGFSYQYAILRKVEELIKAHKTRWIFQGAEIPISLHDQVSHIDFVLSSRSEFFFLIGECKRVDPAKGFWTFAKSPYTWRNPNTSSIYHEIINYIDDPFKVKADLNCRHSERGVMDIGLELKTKAVGDQSSAGGSRSLTVQSRKY